MLLIPSRAMILSLPVELSLTRTIVCPLSGLMEINVSESVWAFASMAPDWRASRLLV
jgi:hypothetical protein